jgi:hypothetical protein
LTDGEAKSYLQNLDAKEIDRIEVQQTRGAEKDAEIQGGVIHIITKNNMVGLGGNISLYGALPESGYYNYIPNARLYFGTIKWNIYGNYSYTQGRGEQYSETLNDNLYNNTSHFSSGNYLYNTRQNTYRVGSILALNSQHSLGFEFNGTSSNPKDDESHDNIIFTNDKNESDNAKSQTKYSSNYDFYNVAVFYNCKLDSLDSYLKLLSNYNNKTSFSDNNLNTVYSTWNKYNVSEQNITNADGKNFSTSLDFRKNIYSKWSFRSGGKFLTTKRNSDLKTMTAIGAVADHSVWNYKENIIGGYFGISKEFSKGIFAYTGIRVENTNIKGESSTSPNENLTKNYTDWFPSFYFSHSLSPKLSYNITYTKNIFRPSFALMNGYSNRITDILYDKGNPDLMPELTDLLTFSVSYGKHSSSLTYRHIPKAITEFFEVIGGITYHTNINYGKTNSVTLDYNYNGNISKWWQTNLYLAGLYTHIPHSYNRKQLWSGLFSSNNRFFWGKVNEASVDFEANTPSISGNSFQWGGYMVNIALSRSFCKDALNIRVGINDLFDSWKMRSRNYVPTLNYWFYAKDQTRQFWCSITYNFSARGKVNEESLKNNNVIEKRM